MNIAKTTLTEDDLLSIQTLPINVIIAAANGRIDLNKMAQCELVNRGLDQSGSWVGFEKARALLNP